MHFGDSILIFILALVLFGPKKLPEIGRQVGKLLAEFRRASNEFKFQIQEEIRNMEDEERKKKLAEAQAASAAAAGSLPAAPAAEIAASSELPPPPTILPPSMGTTVSTERPFAPVADPVEALPVSPELALTPAEIVAGAPAPAAAVPTAENGAPVALETAGPIVELSANGNHAQAGEVPQHEPVPHD